MRILTVITAAAVSLSATTALAAEHVGKAVAVTAAANVVDREGERKLADESKLIVGAVVETDAVGEAQLEFNEGMKIALSTETLLQIKEFNKERITLSLLEGSLRVITSGSSDEVETTFYAGEGGWSKVIPSGTAFDLTVTLSGVAEMVLLKGKVTLCVGDDCQTVETPCALLRAERDQDVEEITLANGRVQETRNSFPFLRSQSSLLERFRIEDLGCTDDPGGLAGFALNAPPIEVVVPTTAAVFLCLVLCPGGGGGPTIDTNNGTN